MKQRRLLFALLVIASPVGNAQLITIDFEGEFNRYGSGTVSGSIVFDDAIDYSSYISSGGFPSVDIQTSDGTFRTNDHGPVGDPVPVFGQAYDTGYDLPGTVDQFDLIVWLSSDFADGSLIGERFLSIYDIAGGGLSPMGGTATVFEAICQNSVCLVESPFVGREGYVTYTYSTVGTVPEPSVLALMGIGLAGIVFARRKKA